MVTQQQQNQHNAQKGNFPFYRLIFSGLFKPHNVFQFVQKNNEIHLDIYMHIFSQALELFNENLKSKSTSTFFQS